MRRKPKPAKTAEQIERERELARDAVRRHRGRRRAEREAMLGTPRYWAIHRVNGALREMIYGKVGSGGEVQTRDGTHDLAAALFDALGQEGAVRLAARLAEEIDTGGTRAQRRHELKTRQVETVGSARATLQGNGGFRHKAIGADGKEPARVLDRTRPYGELFGDTQGRAYEQDNVYFRSDGTAWEEDELTGHPPHCD